MADAQQVLDVDEHGGGHGSACPTLNGGDGSAGGSPTTVGVGGAESMVPVPFPTRDPVTGRTFHHRVLMNLPVDEKLLQTIAQRTGGKYFLATDPESLRRIFGEIDRLEKTPLQVRRYVRYREAFPPLVWAGLGLLADGASDCESAWSATEVALGGSVKKPPSLYPRPGSHGDEPPVLDVLLFLEVQRDELRRGDALDLGGVELQRPAAGEQRGGERQERLHWGGVPRRLRIRPGEKHQACRCGAVRRWDASPGNSGSDPDFLR